MPEIIRTARLQEVHKVRLIVVLTSSPVANHRSGREHSPPKTPEQNQQSEQPIHGNKVARN
jgi:hypothetical protein